MANIDPNVLNHTGMVRPFYGFLMIDCYQNLDLLSSTHVSITQFHSCTHGVWTILYGCYKLLFRRSIESKAAIGSFIYTFVYQTLSEFGFDLQLHVRLLLSFVEPYNLSVSISPSVLSIAFIKRHWWKMFSILLCCFIDRFNFGNLFLVTE